MVVRDRNWEDDCDTNQEEAAIYVYGLVSQHSARFSGLIEGSVDLRDLPAASSLAQCIADDPSLPAFALFASILTVRTAMPVY